MFQTRHCSDTKVVGTIASVLVKGASVVDRYTGREVAPNRLKSPGVATATVYGIQAYDHSWRKAWFFVDITLAGYKLKDELKPYRECWQITGENAFLEFKDAYKTLRKLKKLLKDGETARNSQGQPYLSSYKQWRIVKKTITVEIEVVKRTTARKTEL